jgi:hypothetical protein
LRRGLGARGARLAHIALDVADDRIQLRERQLEAVCDLFAHHRNLACQSAGERPAAPLSASNTYGYSPAAIEISG